MQYVLYKDANSQFRWQLQAANRRVIANSGEGYHNKTDCISAINLVRGTDGNTPLTDIS